MLRGAVDETPTLGVAFWVSALFSSCSAEVTITEGEFETTGDGAVATTDKYSRHGG